MELAFRESLKKMRGTKSKEKFSLRGVIGASDIGFSANGPAGKKTTYQVSIRRSYLQFLFDMIGLPFLPTFTDAQFKVKHTFDRKNELAILGLGAIDDMKFVGTTVVYAYLQAVGVIWSHEDGCFCRHEDDI